MNEPWTKLFVSILLLIAHVFHCNMQSYETVLKQIINFFKPGIEPLLYVVKTRVSSLCQIYYVSKSLLIAHPFHFNAESSNSQLKKKNDFAASDGSLGISSQVKSRNY